MTAFELFMWAVAVVVIGLCIYHLGVWVFEEIIAFVQRFFAKRRQRRRNRAALAKMRLNREFGRFVYDVNSMYPAKLVDTSIRGDDA